MSERVYVPTCVCPGVVYFIVCMSHRVYVSSCVCLIVCMSHRVYVSPCVCLIVCMSHRVYVSLCVYVPPYVDPHRVYVSPYVCPHGVYIPACVCPPSVCMSPPCVYPLREYIPACVSPCVPPCACHRRVYDPSVCMSPPCVCPIFCLSLLVYVCIYALFVCIQLHASDFCKYACRFGPAKNLKLLRCLARPVNLAKGGIIVHSKNRCQRERESFI